MVEIIISIILQITTILSGGDPAKQEVKPQEVKAKTEQQQQTDPNTNNAADDGGAGTWH